MADLTRDFTETTMLVAATRKEDRKVGVLVRIGIAHATTEKHGGGVEQRARAILQLREATDKLAVLRDLITLEGDERGDGLGVVAVVGDAVVILLDAEMLRQEVSADLQRGDAGTVGMQGERDELVHQRQVVDRVAIGRLFKGGRRFREMGPALT